ncbi:MAG: prephenate dehydrogenase [Planctomycetaceae bacterium]|nr:prephenate dehydrogenase [Planctomycetaceae bacterium]
MPSSDPSPAPIDAGTVAIYGVGLIGGSLAAALKERGIARRVLGVGRNRERLDAARAMGLIDESFVDADAAARESDLLVFCTPVDQIAAGVRRAAPHCRPGTLITDAGSVKGPICHELEGVLPDGVTFLGSHPIAGSEKAGFEHSKSDLYQGKVCVLTPTASTPKAAIERLRTFWSSVGSRVLEMSPEEHDTALAMTSHAPHVIASALAAILPENFRQFTGTGFRDTTRIAAGDADLWVAILGQNASAVLDVLNEYDRTLAEFRTALKMDDRATLRRLLELGKIHRDAL